MLMNDKSLKNKIQNIHQALVAANSSINLAKKLLNELEQEIVPSPRELPGEFGTFDGYHVVTEEGKKYAVPENYASKSKLVYGDRMKRIEKKGKSIFKQVDRVKREKVAGILAKKDGEWCVVTSHGSYEVLPAAVNYWGGEEGDELRVLIPKENKQAPFAAVEKVIKEDENDENEDQADKSASEQSQESDGDAEETAQEQEAKGEDKAGAEKAKEMVSKEAAENGEDLR